MVWLVLGVIIFMTPHILASFRSRAPGNIRDKVGYPVYMIAFSIVSAIGLGLMIFGYDQARLDPAYSTPVWIAPEWTRHIILAVMPFAMILLVAAYAPTGYIKKYSKHPMLTAVKAWALVHLIYNGDWPSIILFGSILAFGGLSRTMARIRKDNGARDADARIMGDVVAVVGGLATTAILIAFLHEFLTGRPVLV